MSSCLGTNTENTSTTSHSLNKKKKKDKGDQHEKYIGGEHWEYIANGVFFETLRAPPKFDQFAKKLKFKNESIVKNAFEKIEKLYEQYRGLCFARSDYYDKFKIRRNPRKK